MNTDMWSVVYRDGQHSTEDELHAWSAVETDRVATVIVTHPHGQIVCHIPNGYLPFFFRRRTLTVQQSADDTSDPMVTSVSVVGWRDVNHIGCYTWIYPDGSVAVSQTDL